MTADGTAVRLPTDRRTESTFMCVAPFASRIRRGTPTDEAQASSGAPLHRNYEGERAVAGHWDDRLLAWFAARRCRVERSAMFRLRTLVLLWLGRKLWAIAQPAVRRRLRRRFSG